MAFGALSLSPRFAGAMGQHVVGLWLLFAPLIFWTPNAAAYANDTLVGAPRDHVRDPRADDAGDEPRGYDGPLGYAARLDLTLPRPYLQRLPVIALGAIGFVFARILAAYQLGHIDAVWEPVVAGDEVRNGTEFIITSDVSKEWPIADGGLGAATYVIEVLMAAMGGRSRWRTMPWMVLLFGIAVVPLGVVSTISSSSNPSRSAPIAPYARWRRRHTS